MKVEAPVNVQAVLRDGTRIPIELIYVGRAVDGMHVWVNTVNLPEIPVKVDAERIPAMTRIDLFGQ